MWRLLFLPTCLALDWWSMVRIMRQSRIEETAPAATLLFTSDRQHVPDLMTDIVPETATNGFSTDLLSGTRSPFETVLEYDYNNFWGDGNTNKPQKGKTIIRSNEITGTPTIKTSISSGTLKARL